MIYASPTRSLGALGGAKETFERQLCAVDEEFCDDRCQRYLLAWMKANPEKDACLTDSDRLLMLDTCKRVHAKTITPQVAKSLTQHLIEEPCVSACEAQVIDWVNKNPDDAACVGEANFPVLVGLCMRWKDGSINPGRLQSELASMIHAGCPPAPPIPEPAPPPPPAPPAPPPPPVPEAVTPELTMYTPHAPVTQPTGRGPLRKWGPVVGALLIVGGGIYLLR